MVRRGPKVGESRERTTWATFEADETTVDLKGPRLQFTIEKETPTP